MLPVEQPRRKQRAPSNSTSSERDRNPLGRRFAAGTTKLTQPFINKLGKKKFVFLFKLGFNQ